MLLPQAKKNEIHENICNELLKERAAVLSRAGFAVDDILQRLNRMDQIINAKTMQLKTICSSRTVERFPSGETCLADEINRLIDEFNQIRQKAELQFYYLIVTREALGLRRHQAVHELYRIPIKKKKIQAT